MSTIQIKSIDEDGDEVRVLARSHDILNVKCFLLSCTEEHKKLELKFRDGSTELVDFSPGSEITVNVSGQNSQSFSDLANFSNYLVMCLV